MERRGFIGLYMQKSYTGVMAKRSRSSTEGPGKPDEGEQGTDASPDIIPVGFAVWDVRNAQSDMKKRYTHSLKKRYEEQLDQTIELAVFDGDISTIAYLQTQVTEFRVLQNAMQGDQKALATVADAFAELGRYDYASAFSILAGREEWCWDNVYRKKCDDRNRDQLLRRLRSILPQSGKGTRKKNA